VTGWLVRECARVLDPVPDWADLADGYIAQRWPCANRPLIGPTVGTSSAISSTISGDSLVGGAEMRSRFWLGGSYSSVGVGRLLDRVVAPVARLVRQPSVDDGRELLVARTLRAGDVAPRRFSAPA
jgi:hypothetical protein